MAWDDWTSRVSAALASDDPWQALAEDAELSEEVQIEVVAIFDPGVPAGHFTQQIADLDRAFRYATRSAETKEDLGSLRARGGRPIPVKEGLALEQIRPGSVQFGLVPSERIKGALDSNGLRVLLLVCGLLGGGNVIHSVIDEDDSQKEVTQVQVPAPGGDISIEAPPRADIKLTKKGKSVTIRIRPAP